jgi:hypothetical protein
LIVAVLDLGCRLGLDLDLAVAIGGLAADLHPVSDVFRKSFVNPFAESSSSATNL